MYKVGDNALISNSNEAHILVHCPLLLGISTRTHVIFIH